MQIYLLNKICSLLTESQQGRKPEHIAARWGLKSRMPRDPREHYNCIGKVTWQGSTLPIGLHKDKAVAPGGKLSLARRER